MEVIGLHLILQKLKTRKALLRVNLLFYQNPKTRLGLYFKICGDLEEDHINKVVGNDPRNNFVNMSLVII